MVEVALMKAIEARQSVSLDAVLTQLNELRRDGGGSGKVVTQAPSKFQAEASSVMPESRAGKAQDNTKSEEREAAAVLPSAPAPSTDLQTLWTQVLEAVGRASQFTRSYLLEANPASFDRNLLTIAFDPEFKDHIGLVDNARTHSILQTKLQELGWPNVQIKFIEAELPNRGASTRNGVERSQPVDSPPSSAEKPVSVPAVAPPKPRPSSAPETKENFKNDPLIQKALEIFKGRIVEVRG
jgi:DNA polymerase III subunit gamma/tau